MTKSKKRRLAADAARAARPSVWAHDPSGRNGGGQEVPPAEERGNRRTRRNRQFGHDRAGMNGPSYLQRIAAEQAAVNGPEVTALIADAAEASDVFGDDVLEKAQRDAALAASLNIPRGSGTTHVKVGAALAKRPRKAARG